jgi:hypothetical protein
VYVVEVHKECFVKKGLAFPGDLSRTAEAFPHSASLSRRQLSLLHFDFETRRSTRGPFIWDLNLSMEFYLNKKPVPNMASCITGSSLPVVRLDDEPSHCRLLLGPEALQLQGLSVGSCPGISQFKQAQLIELGGNAFSAGCVCAAVLALISSAGELIPHDIAALRDLRAKARSLSGVLVPEVFPGMSVLSREQSQSRRGVKRVAGKPSRATHPRVIKCGLHLWGKWIHHAHSRHLRFLSRSNVSNQTPVDLEQPPV